MKDSHYHAVSGLPAVLLFAPDGRALTGDVGRGHVVARAKGRAGLNSGSGNLAPNRLADDQRRALEMLARLSRGLTEAAMLANGFANDLLAGRVLAGLAIMASESVTAGGPTIKTERFRITDARAEGER